MEEWTEHLVDGDNDVTLGCEGDQALEDGLEDSCASRVVWIAIMKSQYHGVSLGSIQST